MPPIPQHYLHCSAYLYPCRQKALDGEGIGGSGFLVNVPVLAHPGWGSLYVVTNKHVLDNGGLVVRLNKRDGGVHIVQTVRDQWFDHPEGYDVSALSFDLDSEALIYWSIETDNFITRDIIEDYFICPGDEAFIIGRLITPWGQQRNVPAVRFGNISMMADADEPAIGRSGVPQEAFFVECRSLSGFSGSPAFVSTTRVYSADSHMPRDMRSDVVEPEETSFGLKSEMISVSGTFGPWLLGIDWGHLPLLQPVYSDKRLESVRPDHWVEQNTGIACVLPAWHILDLIMNEREFIKDRAKDKETLDLKRASAGVMDEKQPDG